jgi:hypothetical protein
MILSMMQTPLRSLISLASIGLLFSTSFSPVWAMDAMATGSPLRGNIIQTEGSDKLPTVNEKDIKKIAPGTTLDMVVSTEISSGGGSSSGDEFFGKVSQDYKVDGQVVIPKGTLVHGTVEELSGPKRAGRNGYITTRFDSLIMPDGREITIEGRSSTRDSAGKAAAKVVGRAAGFTLGGGVVGAVMVLRYGGLAAVAASNGYALAGGAAIGGAMGITAAMLTKGKSAMIQPGAELRIKLADGLRLPTVNVPSPEAANVKLDGLAVKVLGMRIGKDPFGEPSEITLTLDIDNKTPNTFSTFEIGLEDEMGNIFYSSPFGDSGMWFGRISPNTHSTNNISFNVDNIRSAHSLIFFNRASRQPLAKVALTDAMITNPKAMHKLSKKSTQSEAL